MAAVERRTKEDWIAREKEIQERLEELNTEHAGTKFSDEIRSEWNLLNAERDEVRETISELQKREDTIAANAEKQRSVENEFTFQTRRPGAVTGESIYDLSTVTRSWGDPSVEGDQLRDRAMRAIEMADFPVYSLDEETSQRNVERLVKTKDSQDGRLSAYIVMTGSPEYKKAFTKALSGAPRSSREDDLLYRAMSLTTTSGGYAVPFVLDPTVIQTGSGAINPYRAIADVQTIAVDEWRGVSSAGITATFQAEAAAVTDASPTLAQPTVSTEMARAFVPFSIEIGMDWANFAGEMGQMFADSKDVLEATKFATGSGTNEPFGVITGATTVFTASNTNSLVVADVYGVHNALGPRFRRNASWTLNNAVADRIRQLDTAGGANLWVQNLQLRSAAIPNGFTDGRMGADLLGKGAYESTGQSGAFTTGQLIAVIGDFSYYKIRDRIGMTVETIPHIFGASQGNLPTGQRGLFAYWRVGAKVADANAFRTLKLA